MMAKLVSCRSCDERISKEARACPRCGAPRRKGGLWAFVLLLIVSFGIVKIVGAAGETEIASPMAANDPVPTEAAVGVTSDQLHKDYHTNEISADDRYRGKMLRITGAVQAIKKDFMDYPYVELWTTNQFEGVHAHFSKGETASLSGISPGDHVVIRCIGDNVILGSPQLKKCVLE